MFPFSRAKLPSRLIIIVRNVSILAQKGGNVNYERRAGFVFCGTGGFRVLDVDKIGSVCYNGGIRFSREREILSTLGEVFSFL